MNVRMDIQNDIVAVWRNVVITRDSREQGWFKFSGFHTSFDSEAQLMAHFSELKRLFKEIKREIQCIVVPTRQSIDDIREKYASMIRGNLRVVASSHIQSVFHYLKTSDELGAEERRYEFYIGVELGKSTLDDEAEDMTYKEMYQALKDWLSSKFAKIRGDHHVYLTEDRLRKISRSNKEVTKFLEGLPFSFTPVTTEGMTKLIPWIFNIGLRFPPNWQNWEDRFTPIFNKQGELIARIQTEDDVLNLQLTGIENPKSRRYLTLHQTDSKGYNHQTHVAFLHMVGMPEEIHFPETRWLEALRSLPFAVGVSLKMSYQDADQRLRKLRRKKSNLEDQANHLNAFGEDAGSNVYQGISHAENIIANVEKEREGGYLMSAIFSVSSSDRDELMQRVNDLIDEYAGMGITLQNTYGLQLRSLLECLPGSRRYVTEFIQDVDINAVTASFFGNRQELGDEYGYYAGRTLSGTAVYVLPGLAASGAALTQSLVTVYTGKTGSGKSMAANRDIYEAALSGAKVLLLDPKSERKDICKWDEKLTELGSELNFISFSTKDEDAGKLDPFLLFDNRAEAVEVSREIIYYLLNINIRNDSAKSSIVTKAVKRVGQLAEPSIRFVKDELRNLVQENDTLPEEHRPMALELASILEEFEDVSLARLIFGKRMNDENVLNYANQFNVLQVDNLQLPKKSTPPEEYTEANIVSVAILFSLTAYMMKFLRMFQNELTVVAIDEAWNFFQNPAGERLIDRLFREGRSLFSPIYLMTQNLMDIPSSMRGQIGTAYCFRTDIPEEIETIQEFMKLEDSAGLEDMMPKMQSGYCLYRDLHQRTGVMQVRILQEHLFDAFDTSIDVRELASQV